MWVAGFYSGASQSLLMGGEPEAFLDGYACGSLAREDAERNRSRLSGVRSAAARARWDREQPKQIVMDANAYAIADAQADANAMHKTDKTRQDNTQQNKTTTKRVRASFCPEMFDALIPEALRSAEFLPTWHAWVEDRHARKKPISEAGAKAQLAKLLSEAVTPSEACRWVQSSIANGWQGIFPPKDGFRRPHATSPQFNGFSKTEYTKGNDDAPLGF